MNFYALAFTAYALANEGRPVAEVLAQMRDPRYLQQFTATPSEARRGESAVYAGHLLLAMVRGGDLTQAHGLALELAHQVKPGQLLPSYVQHPRRLWPADNEVALAALRLYAERFPDEDEVVRAADWLSATLATDALPISELDPVTKKTQPPRGCAIGLTLLMRAMHDREGAAALYALYRERHWQALPLLAGFREWPREVEGAADRDSGPIVLGIGASASIFGMAAAKQLGQTDDYAVLSRSATVAMRLTLSKEEREGALARAILHYVETLE